VIAHYKQSARGLGRSVLQAFLRASSSRPSPSHQSYAPLTHHHHHHVSTQLPLPVRSTGRKRPFSNLASINQSPLSSVISSVDPSEAAFLLEQAALASTDDTHQTSTATGACNILLIHLAKSQEAGSLDKVDERNLFVCSSWKRSLSKAEA